LQAVCEFAREKNVAKLGATIGFHGSEALRRLQVVEIESSSLMRGRSCADDARRRGGGIYPLAADIQKRGEKLMLEVEAQQP
jgi:hypothetical protein